MTKKSLRRQLAAAIAMVLVASMALGTSTFAWFVNNNQVTAQGMKVNAVADGSLVIKGNTNSADKDFTSIGTNGTAVQDKKSLEATLAPVTSFDGVSFGKLADGVKVESADSAMATWTNGTFATTDLVAIGSTTEDSKPYVLTSEYQIASLGEDADVYVKSVAVTKSDVEAALRMSVTINDVTKVYNIGGGTADLVGSYESSTWSLKAPVYTATSDSTATWTLTKVEEATTDTATDVTVRIWYEGQDSKCFTNNITTAGTSITVEFAKVAKAIN